MYYTLDKKVPIECERPEPESITTDDVKNLRISTIFLGINHAYPDTGPVLFETMVFRRNENGEINYMDIDMERYSTWDEAVKGHQNFVERAKNGEWDQ